MDETTVRIRIRVRVRIRIRMKYCALGKKNLRSQHL